MLNKKKIKDQLNLAALTYVKDMGIIDEELRGILKEASGVQGYMAIEKLLNELIEELKQ